MFESYLVKARPTDVSKLSLVTCSNLGLEYNMLCCGNAKMQHTLRLCLLTGTKFSIFAFMCI